MTLSQKEIEIKIRNKKKMFLAKKNDAVIQSLIEIEKDALKKTKIKRANEVFIEAYLVELSNALGFMCLKLEATDQDNLGVPDRILITGQAMHLIEVKTIGGRTRIVQKDFAKRIKKMGGQVHRPYTVKQIDNLLLYALIYEEKTKNFIEKEKLKLIKQ